MNKTHAPIPSLHIGDLHVDFASRCYVMGILNVTPDSFSDGGRYASTEAAVQAALKMRVQGADIIDIGGESTRPGAPVVDIDEELQRVVPVIKALHKAGLNAISIDTRKAAVADAALHAGANMVNDVSGGRYDPAMYDLVAARACPYVIMHSRDIPERMQQGQIVYADVVSDVADWLLHSRKMAIARGIKAEQIIFDPGIGFGKTLEHNLALTRGLGELRALGQAILYGPSRKSFIGQLLNNAQPEQRLEGTLASLAIALQAGADIVRVHDVAETSRFLTVLQAFNNDQDS